MDDYINKAICGDCLDVMKDIPDNSIDCIITDPPYGYLKHKIETNINIEEFIIQSYRILKPDSFFCFFGLQPYLTKWNYLAMENKFTYKNEIIWYKRQGTGMFFDMRRLYENIMVFTKGKKQFNDIRTPYMDNIQTMADFIGIEGFKRKKSAIDSFIKSKERLQLLVDSLNGNVIYDADNKSNSDATCNLKIKRENAGIMNCKTVLNGYKPQNLVSFMPHNLQKFNNEENNLKHPTVKPVLLLEYLIKLMTKENDIILDPFAGTGTTGIAALQTNRQYILIELDPVYCDIINKRLSCVQPDLVGV